jgi:PAS domain S-box-containing protein
MDIEDNFLEVNLKMEELSGYTKEELLKMNFSRLCPDEGSGVSFEHNIRIGARMK